MADKPMSERRLDYEAKFNQWNLSFEFVSEFSLTNDLTVLDGAQVRELRNISPPDRLEQYFQQMRNGTTFPPIVVAATLEDHTDVLIDGNTRASAAIKNKRNIFPAYRVSPIPDIAFAKVLGAALNQMGGQRLEAGEAMSAALTLMEMGWPDESIGREIGYTGEAVRRWRRDIEFSERVERLEIEEPAAQLTKRQRQATVKVDHDRPFAELVRFVADCKPNDPDLKAIVGDVTKATSDEDALTIIDQARRESTPIGPPPSKPYRNPVANQARMHLGGLLKIEPAKVYDPMTAEADRKRWTDLRDLVAEVLAVFDQHLKL